GTACRAPTDFAPSDAVLSEAEGMTSERGFSEVTITLYETSKKYLGCHPDPPKAEVEFFRSPSLLKKSFSLL
ncbi:MAG TPA: hypothetical protein ACFYEI_02735, partial [Candidatus Tripitaka californicus]|uniref:hypothetical protein n=1 Tax=Candidatus Tripitaka californicus TaxID=3367616 RepID=UPI00402628F4